MSADCPRWAPPLLAIQFLTRIPVPGVSRLSESEARIGLGRAIAWFPLIGALVGAITAGTLLLAEQLWSRLVAVLIALIVEARLTGAFHEDAVADFCDGVGGGRDPAHARQIMKDSRIGTYGALGLTLSVALRAALIYTLSPVVAVLAIIGSATFGRLLAVIVMATTPVAPVAAGGLAKDVTANIRRRDVAFAVITSSPGLAPFAMSTPIAAVATFAAAALFLIWFRRLVMKKVGGTTGDCIGFSAYVGQLLLLLAAASILNG